MTPLDPDDAEPTLPADAEAALVRIAACVAAADWDGVARAGEQGRAAFPRLAPDVVPASDARFDGRDRILGEAAGAFASGRLDVVRVIVELAAPYVDDEAAIVEALRADDFELAAAHLLRGHPSEAGRARFWSTAAGLCAAGLLARGDRDPMLLAVAVARFPGAPSESGEAPRPTPTDEWMRARRLRPDAASVAEATVRVCARRANEHEVFAACAADAGVEVAETPELLRAAASCAASCLEEGSIASAHVGTALVDAMLGGREEEGRALIERLRPRAKRRSQILLLDQAWATAEHRVQEVRGEGRPRYTVVDEDARAGVAHAVGELDVVSSTLLVSDPCYARLDSPLQLRVRNAMPGRWTATVYRAEVDGRTWTTLLRVGHVDHPVSLADERWALLPGLGAGVDSAQLGVFDLAHYRDEALAPPDPSESAWYAMCCAITNGRDGAVSFGGVVPHGCVAQSGMGDGVYPVLVAHAEGRAVGVVIDFCVLPQPEPDAGSAAHAD